MAGFLDPELVRAVCRAPPSSAPKKKTVDERGLTPAMRELVDSKPNAPTPLPKLDCIVGSRIELCGLVGTERNWNNRRGTVTAKHLSMHPQNKNVRAWVLEIAFDKPISKTTFFSDHCRLINDRNEQFSLTLGTKTNNKKIKPNEKCPCGSGKKYKKCCGKKKGKGRGSRSNDALPLVGQYNSGRPDLRFKVGDLVQAFAGQGEWINGKIIKVWDQENPYRIELEDGTNVWGPEDTNNFVRDRTPLEPLRFKIGDKVLANALGGWKTGHIIMVWDHGNPYRIELEDGTNVWGPEDIDKFVLPWTSVIPPMPGTNATEKDGKWVWRYFSGRVVVWVERRCARLFLTFFNLFLNNPPPFCVDDASSASIASIAIKDDGGSTNVDDGSSANKVDGALPVHRHKMIDGRDYGSSKKGHGHSHNGVPCDGHRAPGERQECSYGWEAASSEEQKQALQSKNKKKSKKKKKHDHPNSSDSSNTGSSDGGKKDTTSTAKPAASTHLDEFD